MAQAGRLGLTHLEAGETYTITTDQGNVHHGRALAGGCYTGWEWNENQPPPLIVLAPEPYDDHVIVIPMHRIRKVVPA